MATQEFPRCRRSSRVQHAALTTPHEPQPRTLLLSKVRSESDLIEWSGQGRSQVKEGEAAWSAPRRSRRSAGPISRPMGGREIGGREVSLPAVVEGQQMPSAAKKRSASPLHEQRPGAARESKRRLLADLSDAIECTLCMDRPAGTALTCGHCFCCDDDCESSRATSCPVCSMPVETRTRLYGPVQSVSDILGHQKAQDPEGDDQQGSEGEKAGSAFRVGDLVCAYYNMDDVRGWFHAAIAEQLSSTTYRVEWEDGDDVDRVKKASDLRHRHNMLGVVSAYEEQIEEQRTQVAEESKKRLQCESRLRLVTNELAEERALVKKLLDKNPALRAEINRGKVPKKEEKQQGSMDEALPSAACSERSQDSPEGGVGQVLIGIRLGSGSEKQQSECAEETPFCTLNHHTVDTVTEQLASAADAPPEDRGAARQSAEQRENRREQESSWSRLERAGVLPWGEPEACTHPGQAREASSAEDEARVSSGNAKEQEQNDDAQARAGRVKEQEQDDGARARAGNAKENKQEQERVCESAHPGSAGSAKENEHDDDAQARAGRVKEQSKMTAHGHARVE